jgi:membrane-bound ClpP family serine protease
MKQTVKDWLKAMVLLLDEAVIIVLILLALWYFDIEIPLAVAIGGGLALCAIGFLINRAVIPSFHLKKITGREAMIGRCGQALTPLDPAGTVRIDGETWQAENCGTAINTGEEIEIVSLKGLTLTVKKKAGGKRS